MERNINEFENTCGIKIENKILLALSFSHASYLNETGTISAFSDVERLAELGKDLFDLILAEYCFMNIDGNSGQLSTIRMILKSQNLAEEIVSYYCLRDFYKTGKGQRKDDIKSDVILYPVLAVIFLEYSYRQTVKFIDPILIKKFDEIFIEPITDFKTALQNWCQKKKITINYVVTETGPDHQREFKCILEISKVTVVGFGTSKKRAEQEAAKQYFHLHIPDNRWVECTPLDGIKKKKYTIPDQVISRYRFEQLQKVSILAPANSNLLNQSLIHRSYINEIKGRLTFEYGPLAFLGSFVQAFIYTLWIYEHFYELKMDNITNLTKLKAVLMKEENNVQFFDSWNLTPYVLMGKGQRQLGLNNSIKADIIQSLLSSLFISHKKHDSDQFLETLKLTLSNHIVQTLSRYNSYEFDAKTSLQELIHSISKQGNISYTYESHGDAHKLEFHAKCNLLKPNDYNYTWIGKGSNIKEATQNSAYTALLDIKEAIHINQSTPSDHQIRYKPLILDYHEQILGNISNVTTNKLRRLLKLCGSYGIESMLADRWSNAYNEISTFVSYQSSFTGLKSIEGFEKVLSRFQSHFSMKYSDLFNTSEYLKNLLAWLKHVTPQTHQSEMTPHMNGIIDAIQIFKHLDQSEFSQITLRDVWNDIVPLIPRQLKVSRMIDNDAWIFGNTVFLHWFFYSLLSLLRENVISKEKKLPVVISSSTLNSHTQRLEILFEHDEVKEQVYTDIRSIVTLCSLVFAEATVGAGVIRFDFLNAFSESDLIITEKKAVENILKKVHTIQLNAVKQLGSLGGIIHDLKNALMIFNRMLPVQSNGLESYSVDFVSLKTHLIEMAGSLISLLERREPNMHYINLLELSTELSRKIKSMASQKCKIRFSANIVSDEIVTDSSMLHSIIINIAKNAIESVSPEDGNVKVNINFNEEDLLLISIQDNGKGIPEDKLSNLFTSFFTSKSNGSGLGLPSVKRMVDMLNGIIEVESSSDFGTTFNILVPVEKAL